MTITFDSYNFNFELIPLQPLQGGSYDENLVNILTLINVLDVNKDANTSPAVEADKRGALFRFFNKFIPNVKWNPNNLPSAGTIQSKLHAMERHFVPTFKDFKLVGNSSSTEGFKTLFIVPLLSKLGVSENLEGNFLSEVYTQCTIDVAYNPTKYSSGIKIYDTLVPIDPGDRTKQTSYLHQDPPITVDLKKYGLPGVTYAKYGSVNQNQNI